MRAGGIGMERGGVLKGKGKDRVQDTYFFGSFSLAHLQNLFHHSHIPFTSLSCISIQMERKEASVARDLGISVFGGVLSFLFIKNLCLSEVQDGRSLFIYHTYILCPPYSPSYHKLCIAPPHLWGTTASSIHMTGVLIEILT